MDNINSWKVIELFSSLGEWILGITVDDKRNVYFTTGSGGLWTLDYKSKSPRQLHQDDSMYLQGIVWDGKDSLYICDSVQNRILRYRNGEITVLSGNTKSGHQDGDVNDALFCNPYGITMDFNGNLLVTDYHHVRRIKLQERQVETVAGSTVDFSNGGYTDGNAIEAKFSFPSEIVESRDGSIYLNDKGNHCIRKVKDGMVSTLFGDQQSLFKAIYNGTILDNYGNLFTVSDNKLYQANLNIMNVTVSVLPIRSPHSIAIDRRGILYIGSSRIFQVYNTWNSERYLWIAHLKEDSSYCGLARLPKDIIKEVASHVVCAIKQL